MKVSDLDLRTFEAEGAPPLPAGGVEGRVAHEGASIWYAAHGDGSPVLLLHGALGNSLDWGYQVPALLEAGYRAILIDNSGRGRSTLGTPPLGYDLMASEVLAVMDVLDIPKAAIVGWSDGAIIGLTLAMKYPERISRVFAFGCNMDLEGVKQVSPSDPLITRVFSRAAEDYARLSEKPDDFHAVAALVSQMMATQPNYRPRDLGRIRVPIAIAAADGDEFIKLEHTQYLARSIPGAELIMLPGVTHFAPLQRPGEFNTAMLAFLAPACR
jgi:pimeloyl-ACP methyl ester carboxylesterase